MNVATFLTKQAVHNRNRCALRFGSAERTYEDLSASVLTLGGHLLDRGLRKGDRVALMLPNGIEVVESIYACLAAGLVVVPVNYRLHPHELAYILENSGASLLICSREFADGLNEPIPALDSVDRLVVDAATGFGALLATDAPAGSPAALDEPVSVDPEDVAWLFYTSGTTGRPKGAIWNHRMIRVLVMNYLADLYNIDETDVLLHAAPLTHGSGIVALPAIARGATNVILHTASFDSEAVFELIQEHRISHIAFLAPTQIVKLVEDFVPGKYDVGSLKAVCYGGAPIHVEQLKAAMDAFGPVFVQLYGQGEAPITVTGLTRREHLAMAASADPRLASAGRCRTDVEMRILDENDQEVPTGTAGEVVVRGDVVMPGYWANPSATAEALRNGWLHTGDIGSVDDDGYLFLLDRAKDVIITGGNNVYPREVEEVIVTHPGVANVVVIGVPDAYWGEAVHAVVQAEAGAAPTESELKELCATRLAGYKKPKAIDFWETLPQNAYGKILRREVRDHYWQGQTRQVGWSADSLSSAPQKVAAR